MWVEAHTITMRGMATGACVRDGAAAGPVAADTNGMWPGRSGPGHMKFGWQAGRGARRIMRQ